jgi:hypothetical protein
MKRSSSRETSHETPVTSSRDTSAAQPSPGTKQTPKQYVAPIPMYMIGTHASVVPPPPDEGSTKDGNFRSPLTS